MMWRAWASGSGHMLDMRYVCHYVLLGESSLDLCFASPSQGIFSSSMTCGISGVLKEALHVTTN